MYLDVDGKRINFTLDVGKRSKYVLCVHEGRLTVRVPYGFSKQKVYELISDNLQWIESTEARSAQSCGLPVTYENGEVIRLLGEEYTLFFDYCEKYHSPKLIDNKLMVSVFQDFEKSYICSEVDKFISELAYREISESINRLSKIMGLTPNKVTVKSLNASWGRCISNGNISINYKIITHSKKAVDYVCAHELAHLRHMNHSKEFWELVEKYIPDWKEIRSSLKE